MLKTVLLLNALSCALFGIIFVAMPIAASNFIGNPPILLLQILGAGLVVNAVLLVVTALKKDPSRIKIITFAIGDGIWVLTTAILLLAGLWITTPQGILWSIGVAIFVGLCGLAQFRLVAFSGA